MGKKHDRWAEHKNNERYVREGSSTNVCDMVVVQPQFLESLNPRIWSKKALFMAPYIVNDSSLKPLM